MTSMKDVAALAGVSISTVSRVISGSIPVDQATAERVRDAISSLDFRPNLLASGLRSKSGKLIGLVVPGLYEPFASIIGFLEHATARHGYNLVVGNSRSQQNLEQEFVDNLIRRHVDGIIFTPISHRSQAMDHLEKTDVPIVWFDRVWDHERSLTVRLDNQTAGELAARHLCEHGHRRIAVVTGPESVDLCHDRLNGFRETARQAGVEVPADHVYEGDFTFESGLRVAQQILNDGLPFSAIWAQNDLMAIALLKVFQSSGVSVPGDVSLVGMDGIPLTRMVHPELTTVAQPIERMCEDLLTKVLHSDELTDEAQRHTVFQPVLFGGQSVRTIETHETAGAGTTARRILHGTTTG